MPIVKGVLFLMFGLSGFCVHAAEAWIHCYGQKSIQGGEFGAETRAQVSPSLLQGRVKELMLWAEEESNIKAYSVKTRKNGSRLIENSNTISNRSPLKQPLLVPGTWKKTVAQEDIFVLRPEIYDDTIRVCVQTLNRGKGRKSEGYPPIDRDYFLVKLTATGMDWWNEHLIYRQKEDAPAFFEEFPFGKGRNLAEARFIADRKLADEFLRLVLEFRE